MKRKKKLIKRRFTAIMLAFALCLTLSGFKSFAAYGGTNSDAESSDTVLTDDEISYTDSVVGEIENDGEDQDVTDSDPAEEEDTDAGDTGAVEAYSDDADDGGVNTSDSQEIDEPREVSQDRENVLVYGDIQGTADDQIKEDDQLEEEEPEDSSESEEPVEEWYDYYFPCEDEISLIAGWDYWLGDAFSAYVVNDDYPEGQYFEYIKIKDVKTSALSPVKVVAEEDEEGNIYYSLTAKKFAWGDSATVTITYDDPITGEEDASYEVSVNVVDTITDVFIASNAPSNQVRPGGTIELYANVEQQWDDGSASLPGELEDEVILEWSVDRDDVTLQVEEDTPHVVNVTVCDEKDQDVLITATVYAKDGDAKGEELASSEYFLWVTDEYYEIRYTTGNENGIDVLYPGQDEVVVPGLYYYDSETPDGEPVKDVIWAWDYDENALTVEENEQGGYIITRRETYGTDLGLHAYIPDEEDDIEAAYMGWYLEDVNSEIWFEDPDWYVMYTDSEDPYTLQLNAEQLENMAAEVEYQFSVSTEEGEENVEIPDNCWSVNDDYEISLNAKALYEVLKAYETEDSVIEVTLRAVASNKITEEEVSDAEYSFAVREPYFEYWFSTEEEEPEFWPTLAGTEEYMWIALDGAYYCAAAPDGDYIPLEMKGYEIENTDILKIEPVEADGITYYNLIGKKTGETSVTITYVDFEGNEQTMNAVVVVSDEDYYLVVDGDSNSILPGDSLTLTAYLYRYYVDKDGNLARERVSEDDGLYCEWDFSWGNDEGLFELEPSEEDSFICTVKASKELADDYANGSVYCTVYDVDGNFVSDFYDYYIESTNDLYYDWTLSDNCWFKFNQKNKYYYLGYDNPVTFTVEELVSHYIDVDGENVETMALPLTGITYRLLTGEDTDEVLKIDENGNGSYTVTRKADGDTSLRIAAYRNKTLLEEYEVTFLDYSVYTLADHEVDLCPGESDTVELSIHAGNYDPVSGTYEEIDPWSVEKYEWLNEEEVKKLGADLTVTQSEDTASFTISLKDGSTAEGNITIELAAYLLDRTVLRQTVSLGKFGGHDYAEEVVKEATATEDGQIRYTCTKCGDTYTETIPKTGTPDNGTTDPDNGITNPDNNSGEGITNPDNNSGSGTADTGNSSGDGITSTSSNPGNGTANANTTNKTPSNTSVGTKTGDNAPVWMLIVLLAAAICGISGVTVYRRRVR